MGLRQGQKTFLIRKIGAILIGRGQEPPDPEQLRKLKVSDLKERLRRLQK